MIKYKNLYLIGTSHIAIESIKEVASVISKIRPEIIALELDRKRFQALSTKEKRKLSLKDIRKIGLKGYLFNLIGAFIEKKLAKSIGVLPGSEMIKAIKLASKFHLQIALIDQDIEITLKRLSSSITWREKFRFLYDIIKGLILRKPEVNFDLRTVPSNKIISELIQKVKERYPSFYLTLIEERNQIMAKHLYNLIHLNPDKNILAIVGAGHEQEILKMIKKVY